MCGRGCSQSAGPDADLGALEGHELEVVAAEASLRFEHEPAGESRRLRLAARPERALAASDLPSRWRDAEVLVLGPLLADDLDVASFTRGPVGLVGLLAQGLQRRVASDGGVTTADAPSEALRAACDARTTVFLSSEEVAGWPRGAVRALASGCARGGGDAGGRRARRWIARARRRCGWRRRRRGRWTRRAVVTRSRRRSWRRWGVALTTRRRVRWRRRWRLRRWERMGPAELPRIEGGVDRVVGVEAGDAAVAQ